MKRGTVMMYAVERLANNPAHKSKPREVWQLLALFPVSDWAWEYRDRESEQEFEHLGFTTLRIRRVRVVQGNWTVMP